MTDLDPDSPRDAPTAPPARIPRWVIVFAIVALGVGVAFAIVHLAGGGMRHHG